MKPPAEITAPVTVAPVMPEIRVVDSFAHELASPVVWNELVRASGATPYQTHEWLSGWWDAFGSGGNGRGQSLYIVVFTLPARSAAGTRHPHGSPVYHGRDITPGTVVAGYAPLFAEPGGVPGTIRLRFVGSGEAFSRTGGRLPDNGLSDYLDFIVPESLPGYPDLRKAAGEAFRRHLVDRGAAIESVDLVNLIQEGAAMTGLTGTTGSSGNGNGIRQHGPAPLEATLGYRTSMVRFDRCPYITVDSDAAEYVATREAGVRRRLRQAMKTVPGGELTLRMAFSRQDIDDMFPRLVALHQDRWNRAGFTGLFRDRRVEGFQKHVAERFLNNGWLWFGALSDKSGPVATRLGFTFDGRLYDYISGFDDRSPAAKKRPGMALLMQMHDDARRAGIGTLDLLRGDEAYKAELASGERPLYSVRLLNEKLAGGASRGRDMRELIGFHLRREADLLSVQRDLHGWALALPAYLRFRISRLKRKSTIQRDNTKASS